MRLVCIVGNTDSAAIEQQLDEMGVAAQVVNCGHGRVGEHALVEVDPTAEEARVELRGA